LELETIFSITYTCFRIFKALELKNSILHIKGLFKKTFYRNFGITIGIIMQDLAIDLIKLKKVIELEKSFKYHQKR